MTDSTHKNFRSRPEVTACLPQASCSSRGRCLLPPPHLCTSTLPLPTHRPRLLANPCSLVKVWLGVTSSGKSSWTPLPAPSRSPKALHADSPLHVPSRKSHLLRARDCALGLSVTPSVHPTAVRRKEEERGRQRKDTAGKREGERELRGQTCGLGTQTETEERNEMCAQACTCAPQPRGGRGG